MTSNDLEWRARVVEELGQRHGTSLHGLHSRFAGGLVGRLGERVSELQIILLGLIADGEVEAFRGPETGRLLFRVSDRDE